MTLSILILLVLLSVTIVLWIVVPISKRRREEDHRKRIEAITSILPDIEPALEDISAYYNYSHYITESERLSLYEKFAELFKLLSTIINYKELDQYQQKETIKRLYDALSRTEEHKRVNNEHFIDNQLKRLSKYFDSVLAYPLDQQQREAIVSLEDNVLVISSAGSGKTMTTVGKVRYLIDVQKVAPEKILLITFTRKAAESLSERMGEKNLRCLTFHKLALDIIGDVTNEKPTIAERDFAIQVYHRLFEEDDLFQQAITDYILRARYKMKDEFEYQSKDDYLKDRQQYGIQAYFKDMDGHPVFCKSDEESKICDFLGSHGVKFRYEEEYEHKTSDNIHRQYCPDFSIYIDQPDGTVRRIYLEHFAINEQNRCPSFFSQQEETNYLQGIEWKINLHKYHGTKLLSTSSAGFHRGDVFKVLKEALLKEGVAFKKASNKDISRDLANQEESILNTLTAFNSLMKSRNISIDSILASVSGTPDRFMINDIVIPFIEAYRKSEEETNQIDFTDAILRATDLCNNGHRPDYDYILVDEFQDISLDRYRFLQSLRREQPLTKLFCVGDDWQSIYRFTGSDMALFKHFDTYFGFTKKCLMETTYRFGEPAINESSRFILSNPEQAVKHVHPFKEDSETKLDFIFTKDRENIVDTIKSIADQIPEDKELMLLGRYSFDKNVFKGSDLTVHETLDRVYVCYGKRRMTFMTIHKSKGLECDYVILLNCNGGAMGFPANIADPPILKYVLSEPDAYAFSEERRIFYVGITRAKKHTWVLYDVNNPSPFIKEFVDTRESNQTEYVPESELCPRCKCGRMIEVKTGKARNGNPYSVYACSNKKKGCNYKETVFVNLNHYRKPYSNN